MEKVRAIVQKVVRKGPHGPYAVATSDDVSGSITFSLTPPCWKEKGNPQPGVVVVLSDIQRKRAGWRAMNARFMKLKDEKEARA